MSDKVFQPLYFYIMMAICCLGIIICFILIDFSEGIFSLKRIVFTLAITMILFSIIVVPSIKKITRKSENDFAYFSIIKKRNYTHADINEVWIDSIPAFFIKKYLRIIMNDGTRIGIIGMFWNDYKELKSYFITNNKSKVKVAEASWQEVD